MSNEPITRKEMFMAKASGENVNTPEPITREEKFLEKIAENGGKANSWKDLGEKTVMGDTLTWDGNTEGLVYSDGEYMVRVSESTPKLADFANGGTLTMSGQTFAYTSENVITMGDIVTHAEGAFCVALVDNADYDGLILPKKGLYFANQVAIEVVVTSLTINGYNGFPRTEITPLPNKYLDIIETVGGDTLTWDGNTEGLVSVVDNEDSKWCKIYDVSPKFENGTLYHSVYSDGSFNDSGTIYNDEFYEGKICAGDGFFIVYEDGVTENILGVTFPERGIYFVSWGGGHLSSLTINGYTGFTKEQVKQEYIKDVILAVLTEKGLLS